MHKLAKYAVVCLGGFIFLIGLENMMLSAALTKNINQYIFGVGMILTGSIIVYMTNEK